MDTPQTDARAPGAAGEGFSVLIPARLASTRLARKVLLEIAGKPMVQRVYERALASGAEQVVVATDSEEVLERCRGFGACVQMTAGHHRSGTDRLAEAVAALGLAADRIVVNVQADEPLLPPGLIRQVAQDLAAHAAADLATLCTPIAQASALFDPNVVKVVFDRAGFALYFSRAPIPWHRDRFRADTPGELPAETPYYRHLGLYAYRVRGLRRLAAEPASALELAESLEQLRALAAGMRIHLAVASEPPEAGVDTAADLERVRAIVERAGIAGA
jgi:3-deoxy-manno-octulosonate cytidylyltransferase (CMP-KDO synthetase)